MTRWQKDCLVWGIVLALCITFYVVTYALSR